jgi:hypothetical protein
MFTAPRHLDIPHFTLRGWSVADAPALRKTLETSDAHLRAWTPWVVDGRVPGLSLEERLARHAEDFAAGTEWVYGMFSPDEHPEALMIWRLTRAAFEAVTTRPAAAS